MCGAISCRSGKIRAPAANLQAGSEREENGVQPSIVRTGFILALAATAVSAVGQILLQNALLQSAFAQNTPAQGPDEFYRGKTVDFVIGYPTGGSNDVWGRLVGRHIGNHIPGKPNVVPKNMPGAGSFLAANQIFNVLAKDGTVIGIAAPTIPLDEKLGTQGVRFKTSELNWIGRADTLVNMLFLWKTSPVKTVADAMRVQSTLSGTGAGSTVSIYPTVMNNVLGTKFKLVMGYRGSNEAMLAVERGEVEGHSTSWTALKVAHPNWVAENTVTILVQFARKRHAELPDIPTAVELARNEDERAVLAAIMNSAEVGTAFFTAPAVPADRVAALRRAFDATMADPQFLADVAQTRLAVSPLTGEELQRLVGEVSNLSPGLLAKVRAAYGMTRQAP
jgi:tripartite-type tricarboxylate transporter receptor subunit TctC